MPPLALVEKIIINPYDKTLKFNDFRILESKNHSLNLLSQIPKDLGVCEDCLHEIRDKNSPISITLSILARNVGRDTAF